MPVHLDVATDGLPDDLATTAYYVACEALTNAAKHAGAERVAVRVSHASDVLRIRVEDDGQGGAVLREGSGLAGLVDRVSALGGSMTMSSPRGSGTVIEAELPCAS
jgi:signal transduction histidine kinase